MAEHRTLQRKLDRLARTLDPKVVSTSLFSKELVDQRAWEEARKDGPHYDRSLSLLEEVLRAIKADSQVFYHFCETLEEEKVTEGLAAELREACEEELRNPDKNSKDDAKPGKKRPAQDVATPEAKKPSSRLKTDTNLDDKLLMEISWEVGGKWEELGVAVGLDHKVISNAVSSASSKPDHMKAFYVLQAWKKRHALESPYKALAAALEDQAVGLNSCAQKHCYTNS